MVFLRSSPPLSQLFYNNTQSVAQIFPSFSPATSLRVSILQTLKPSERMHRLWSSTICLHLSPLSAPSSALEPNCKKQSSRSFLVSGHAQHLLPRLTKKRKNASWSALLACRRETKTHEALSPSEGTGYSMQKGETGDVRLVSFRVERVQSRVCCFTVGQGSAERGRCWCDGRVGWGEGGSG